MTKSPNKMQRKITQFLAPVKHSPTERGQYDIYPGYPIGDDKIECGYEALVDRIKDKKLVILDGFSGVYWDDFRKQLEAIFKARGITAGWHPIEAALHPEVQIESMITPYLGGDDPLFGHRYSGSLADFYNSTKLQLFAPDPQLDFIHLNIAK